MYHTIFDARQEPKPLARLGTPASLAVEWKVTGRVYLASFLRWAANCHRIASYVLKTKTQELRVAQVWKSDDQGLPSVPRIPLQWTRKLGLCVRITDFKPDSCFDVSGLGTR